MKNHGTPLHEWFVGGWEQEPPLETDFHILNTHMSVHI